MQQNLEVRVDARTPFQGNLPSPWGDTLCSLRRQAAVIAVEPPTSCGGRLSELMSASSTTARKTIALQFLKYQGNPLWRARACLQEIGLCAGPPNVSLGHGHTHGNEVECFIGRTACLARWEQEKASARLQLLQPCLCAQSTLPWNHGGILVLHQMAWQHTA